MNSTDNNEEVERNMAERTAQLEAAVKDLEAFSYSVAHDLRAPLRAIDGFSRILLQENTAELSADSQRYLRMIRENTQQMGNLIDDLLAFSRLNRQGMNRQRVQPAELARRALADLQVEHEGHDANITIHDLPACYADPALLRQVFVNLLGNALKFTRRLKDAQIEVDFRREKDEVVYFVKDNGVGFDMRYADQLFGVFQRNAPGGGL